MTASMPGSRELQAIQSRLSVMLLLVLLLSCAALSVISLGSFEQVLRPRLENKARTLGGIVASDIGNAIQVGVPFASQVGMGDYLRDIATPHPELRYVAVSREDGTIIYHHGEVAERLVTRPLGGDSAAVDEDAIVYDIPVPIVNQEAVVGWVHIGVNKSFVQGQLKDLTLDVLTALMVSLLLTFEVLRATVVASLVSPINLLTGALSRAGRGDFAFMLAANARDEVGMAISAFDRSVTALRCRVETLRVSVRAALQSGGARAAGLSSAVEAMAARFGLGSAQREQFVARSAYDVRLPLFLFVFADEMQKAFFPLFVKDLVSKAPIAWIETSVVIGLPISLYMFVIAAVTPWAGSWTDRYGSRRIFLIGLAPAVAGFVGQYFAQNVPHLLLCKVAIGIGYALITIAAQGYLAKLTTGESRARSMSVFITAIMTASICGTAVGGVLADRIGPRGVFLVGALLSVIAGVVLNGMLQRDDSPVQATRKSLSPRDLWRIASNYKFGVLLLLSAVPAKAVLTGFLFYLVPLYLSELGATLAETGRVMMTYSLVIILVGPGISSLADKFRLRLEFMVGGCVLSGAALLIGVGWQNSWAVLAMVLVLGLAHAMSTATQIAVVPDLCPDEVSEFGQTSVLSVLRMLERVGSVLGPFAMAHFVAQYGPVGALGITGATVIVTAIVLAVFAIIWRRSKKETIL